SIRVLRHLREQAAYRWDRSFAALSHAARAAADDGAPGLHPALFGSLRRARRRSGAPAAAEAHSDSGASAVPVRGAVGVRADTHARRGGPLDDTQTRTPHPSWGSGVGGLAVTGSNPAEQAHAADPHPGERSIFVSWTNVRAP